MCRFVYSLFNDTTVCVYLCTACLMTLSNSHQTVECLENEELETLWKESVAVKFEMLYRLFTGGSEEKYEPSVRMAGL